MTQSSDKFIASTRAIRTNEKELERRRSILDFASSRLLIHQIAKSKRFYLKLRESMTAWLLKLQQENVFVTKEEWRQRYASKSKELSKWSMRENELLRRDLAIYVSNDFATKKKILRMNHDDFDANHFARVRIENAIRRKYYWSNMIDDIAEYVRNCSNCQRVRIHHHKLYEDLTLISLDDVDSFHTMIMNFIIDISFARDSYIEKINDTILVLIDKLTKYATYITTIKDLNVERLADLMWREFICRHDMMRSIISNRDSLFTSHFWSTLCWYLRAKRKFNIAFPSQTNDQTKCQNQVLKHYLRVYCNYKQNNWSKLLLMTSFAYNNSIHSMIKKTSNELLIKYIASFASAFESKTLREKISLTIERTK